VEKGLKLVCPLFKMEKNLYFKSMNHSIPLDIIVLVIFVALLFFRLRKVLGEREEGGPPPIDPALLLKAREAAQQQTHEKQNTVVDGQAVDVTADKNWAQSMPNYQWVTDATTHNRLVPVVALDATFHPQIFLQGARRAYEMIVTAFARGDLETLEMLLSPSLFTTFKDEIAARQDAGQKRELMLHEMRSALISDAKLQGTTALIGVDFITEQSITLRDQDGQILDGLDGRKHVLQERWTFSNDLKDDETLWRLVETDAIDD
jgi:predicted lipid-binding transport protein (Tim44 family)